MTKSSPFHAERRIIGRPQRPCQRIEGALSSSPLILAAKLGIAVAIRDMVPTFQDSSIYLMQVCPACQRSQPQINRFCVQCGGRLDGRASGSPAPRPASEQLNINVLYGMVVLLILAILFPPWETPPMQEPEFLGMHFVLSPPAPEAVVSRMLLTIELVTIAIAGMYGAFLFRGKS